MSRIQALLLPLAVALAFSVHADAVVDSSLLERLARGERVRVIVALREPAIPQARVARIAAMQASAENDAGRELAVDVRWRHVPAFAGELSLAAVGALARNADVIAIGEDRGGSIASVQSGPLIGSEAAHTRGYRGFGVTVAVLDTGVQRTHPDFAGRVVAEECYCRTSNGKGCCPNGAESQRGAGAARDDNGHGTNVTGIVAGGGSVAAPGVAPSADIVAMRVTDAAGNWTYSSQVISALDSIISSHPEVRVVNISLGTDRVFASDCDGASADAAAIGAAVRTLRARGTLVFAASGNQGSKEGVTFPACVGKVVSVGAVYDAEGGYSTSLCRAATTRPDEITCFSNSGPNLDLLAPGATITSSGRNGGLSSYGGTSQAAPHAAGAAAILISARPAMTADEVETLLRDTGTVIADPRNGVGVPRIDLYRALRTLLPPPARKQRSSRH